MLKLFKEFKRRKVLTTMGGYGAAAFIIIQVADIVEKRLLLPDWTVTFLIFLAIRKLKSGESIVITILY